MMYEGATGRRPFDGDSLDEVVSKVLAGMCEPPHVANPAVPLALSRVITRAMSMNRTERYTSLWATGLALLPLARTRDRDAWNEIFARNTSGMRAATDYEPRLAAATAIIVEDKGAARPVTPTTALEPPRPAPASPPAPMSAEPAVTRRPAGRWLAMVIGAAVLLALGVVAVMRAR
jgi:serine/threonine-protein kinase